jgi:hypothetical protein
MRTLDSRIAATLDLEPQMTPDWNAIRLDLLQVDEPMRAALREMRPFFAKSLPGILTRYYDKVRHYDPSFRSHHFSDLNFPSPSLSVRMPNNPTTSAATTLLCRISLSHSSIAL